MLGKFRYFAPEIKKISPRWSSFKKKMYLCGSITDRRARYIDDSVPLETLESLPTSDKEQCLRAALPIRVIRG